MRPDRKSSAPPHPPRLCNIVRSPTFSGYGFNLHTIKNKTGQYIGHVDEGSPAEKALLKPGDRIVEVNGVNIDGENHTQVVSRITLVANETNLLVVDDEGDQWYQERNITISSELPEVVRGSSVASLQPPTPPAVTAPWGHPAPPPPTASPALELTAPPHPPRLCHIVRSPTFSGYGFILHTVKDKTGQYIAEVEEESPAEKALLKPGDRIVEINGVNIDGENHTQVAIRIKLVPNETILLVVDDEGDQWYKERNITISSELLEVVRGFSVPMLPSTSSSEGMPACTKNRRSEASASSATNSEAYQRMSASSSSSPHSSVGAPSPTPAHNFPSVGPQRPTPPVVPPLWGPPASPKLSNSPASESTTPPHPARLCNIVRSPTFTGYGFNLHTIKNKTGQYIGHVDEGSPAEKALLKQGDRIVEVNGVNIASENHKQVVSRIKLVTNETNLLVVDDEGDQWYKEHNITISSELPDVVRGSSVARRPSTSSSEGKPARSEDRRSVASVSSASNSEASNRHEIQEVVAAAVTSTAVVDSDTDSIAEVSAEKDINGDSKSVVSSSDDDKEVDEEKKVSAPVVKEVVAVATNGNYEKPEDKSSDSEESEDEGKTTSNNVKNTTSEVQQIAAKESVAEKPTLKTMEEEDRDSESGKSRSVSMSSASSRGSAGHSQGTNPVVDKSPVSTSPSPPSSVGAPSPTPVYNFPNIGGLNLNMTAAEMKEMIAAKKKNKKDIRNTEIDLRTKYEIVQKL